MRLTVAEGMSRCPASVRALQRESPLAGAWQTVQPPFERFAHPACCAVAPDELDPLRQLIPAACIPCASDQPHAR